MATYYIRADGTADKADATGGTGTGDSMSIATHNAATFAAGDTINVLSDGGTFRGTILTPPTSGSSGNRITYEFDSDAQLSGADLITGWTADVGTSSVASFTGGSTSYNVHSNTGDGYENGNEWTATADMDIAQVVIQQYQYNSPSGDVWIQIYDESGGVPNAKVTNGKSSVVDVSTLLTGYTGSETAFTFSTPPSLTNGSTYFFMVESDVAIDGTNFLRGRRAVDATFDQWYHTQADSWTEYDTYSINMVIYEEVAGTANVWQATVASEPEDLFYDGTLGVKETAKANLNTEGEWFWDSGILYLYSTTDPDTAYTDPGVEAVQRNVIYCRGINYLTFNGNGCDIRNADRYPFYIRGADQEAPGTDITIDGFVLHDGTYQGIVVWDISNVIIRNCEVYRVKWNACQVSSSSTDGNTNDAQTNILVEECYFHECGHGGIDIHNQSSTSRPMSNVTVRYNLCSNPSDADTDYDRSLIFFLDESSGGGGGTISDCYVYGNVVFRSTQWGIWFDATGTGVPIAGVKCYNNICAYNGTLNTGGGILLDGTGGEIKNNICAFNQVDENNPSEIYAYDSGGTANVMDYNCVYHPTNTNLYYWDGSYYTAANIYSSTGQQEHAVHADPSFTSAVGDDYTLASDSPCIGAGDSTLGSPYNTALLPGSTWPDGVVTADQDDY